MNGASYNTPAQDKYRTAKWGFESDQELTNTYHKSHSINKSTEYGSRSPYRSTAVSRLETAKKTIDEVILDLSEKKDMNDEAMREVRSVNSEIIQDYRKGYAQFEPRPLISKSSVSHYPPRSAQASTHHHVDDSLTLRNRFNEQLRKNNVLMARLQKVEQQNQYLRQNQMSFRSAPQDSELRAENQRLKQQLSEISSIPQQIFSQIEQLKRQNQHLRSDTVRLLRKADKF